MAIEDTKFEKDYHKTPRLYIDAPLLNGTTIKAGREQAHYLVAVMRRKNGDTIRLFNGKDGEWRAILKLEGKKDALFICQQQTRAQRQNTRQTHLFFAPIKKSRMELLIEKATELGVTHLHPLITAHTENRHPNQARMHKHMIEAAEQCERLDIPALSSPQALESCLENIKAHNKATTSARFPVYACVERQSDVIPALSSLTMPDRCGFLIGPEGGFSSCEIETLQHYDFVQPVHLGDTILRAETAAFYCLALAKACRENASLQ
jgi:16S rRNA (uracil1498-N3)-methyltransferase